MEYGSFISYTENAAQMRYHFAQPTILLLSTSAKMLSHPLNQHIKRNEILAALRYDDVRAPLARLHELLVHRLYRR